MRNALKIIWQCDRKGFLLKLLYTALGSILPLANLYVLKVMVDGITSVASGYYGQPNDVLMDSHFTFFTFQHSVSGISAVLISIAVFCAIMLLNRLISILGSLNGEILTQKLIDHINGLIQTQSLHLDMAYYDNPRFHDTFHRAQQEAAFRPIRILENLVSVFGALISLGGVAVMLLVASWQVVVVMLVAMIPTFTVRLVKSRRIYRFRRETTQLARRSSYYGALLTNRIYAKEVRAFAVGDYLRSLYVSIRRQLVDRLLRISRRLAIYDALTSIVEVGAVGICVFLMLKPVSTGAITVGSFVMLFEAFRRGQGYLSSLVGGISGLYEHKLFINNLFEFLELKPNITTPDNPEPFPERVTKVEFDDVTFSYPDMIQPTLSHFSFRAERGEVSYIRGENGFGKTTMLKLLLRLYDPQQGSVRINGIDIRRFSLADLRRNVSAIFQDYVQLQLTVRENVEFGDLNHRGDALRLADALRNADAETIVNNLPKGIDTQLGRQFDDGQELSMGQWQRVALARQLFADGQVLFFDEPTAWMDKDAREHFTHLLDDLCKSHVVLLVQHSIEE